MIGWLGTIWNIYNTYFIDQIFTSPNVRFLLVFHKIHLLHSWQGLTHEIMTRLWFYENQDEVLCYQNIIIWRLLDQSPGISWHWTSYVGFTQCLLHSKNYTGLLPLAINHKHLYILSIIYQSSIYPVFSQSIICMVQCLKKACLDTFKQKCLCFAKLDICQSPNSLAIIFSANEYGPLYTPLIVFGI